MSKHLKSFVEARVHVKVSPAEALKIIRELQEVSQNELARKTGISQSNISALENGSIEMGKNIALKLAKALKVHPAVLLFPDYDVQEAT